MTIDYYNILGIEKNASDGDIKSAYKKHAMRCHPDRHNGEQEKKNAEEEFKKVTEAYTVLSDPEKRTHYDRFGTAEVGEMPHDINDIFRNMFGGNPFGGGGPQEMDIGSIFSGMFGGGRSRQQHANAIHCEVSLEEVYNGTTKQIEYELSGVCHACNGIGALDPKDIIKCMSCNGEGNITQRLGPMFITQSTCPACFGNGTSIKTGRRCGNCNGNKEANYKKKIKMEVPKGIPEGYQHKLDGKGCYNKGNKCNNDLVIIFHYGGVPPNVVVHDNGNIKMVMDIKFEELLCGFSKNINLYGQVLNVASTGYFNPGKPMVFKGKGMPNHKKSSYADLVIHFKVEYNDDDKIKKYNDVFLKIFKREPINVESNSLICA